MIKRLRKAITATSSQEELDDILLVYMEPLRRIEYRKQGYIVDEPILDCRELARRVVQDLINEG